MHIGDCAGTAHFAKGGVQVGCVEARSRSLACFVAVTVKLAINEETAMRFTTRLLPTTAALCCLILGCLTAALPARAEPPKGWRGGGVGYELATDTEVKHGGKASGSLKATDAAKNFGALTQPIRADNYRGKRVRLVAYVKSEGVKDWAGLWLR